MFFNKKNKIIDIYHEFVDSDMHKEGNGRFKRGAFTFEEYKGYIILVAVDNNNVSGVLKIPDGVSIIHTHSLTVLENITGIEMPDSVQVIGEDAIAYCDKLRYIQVSANIYHMGFWAISYCKALTEVRLPRQYDEPFFDQKIQNLYDGKIKIIRF